MQTNRVSIVGRDSPPVRIRRVSLERRLIREALSKNGPIREPPRKKIPVEDPPDKREPKRRLPPGEESPPVHEPPPRDRDKRRRLSGGFPCAFWHGSPSSVHEREGLR
jgi:hypothetical protein